MAKLTVRDGKGAEYVHEIADDVTSIGRSSANIIQIKDDKASRQHCRVEKAGDGYRLVDLGSRNGTEVNGVKVSGQTLKPGDAITIGQCRIVFDAPMQVSGEELGATVAVTPLSEAEAARPSAPAAAASGGTVALGPDKPASSAPRFVLEVVEGAAKGRTVELGVESITIGRHASNKLAIEDEAASNYHAEVTKEAIGYVISDLGSTNGTKVNGEKVVKSPLAHNSRIRIGATEIVFKNLGAPTEEDAVFGTVVLDSEKLDQELASARKSGGAAGLLKLLAGAAVVFGLAYGTFRAVRWWRTDGGGGGAPVITDVANAGFNEGTDANGSPKGWQILNDDPKNLVLVDKGKGLDQVPKNDREPEKYRYSLKIQRDEAARPEKPVECRQSGAFEVDKGSAYRAAVRITSPGGQGIYGLRLTWVGPEGRELDEYATIAGPHPDWDLAEMRTRPPSWAGKLKLALVAYGGSGSTWFDNVELQRIPAEGVTRTEETVDYRGVRASFDASGRLDLERGGARALRGMIVAAGQGGVETVQSLARPADGYPRREGEETLFRGNLFDFSRRARFNYDLAASKGEGGVRLRYGFSTDGSELTLDSLQLRLDIEPAFAGKAEAFTAAGRKPFASGELPDVNEVLLHSARGDAVLALSFARPAAARMEDFGERKRLTVIMARSPSLGVAPREFAVAFAGASQAQARELEGEFARVTKLFEARNWKDFPAAAADFRARFPEAADKLREVGALEAQLKTRQDAARKAAGDAVKRAVDASDNLSAWQLAYDQGKKTLRELDEEWAGVGDLPGHFATCLVDLERTKKVIESAGQEKEAQETVEKGKKFMDQRMWGPAIAYFSQAIAKYPETRAAASAKQLKKDCEDRQTQENYVAAEEQRILKEIHNFELNGQWDQAIRRIKADPSYIKYRADMKEVAAKLEELEAKAGGR